MISAESFIEAARQRGFQHYSGVPCSFLTPFINYVINDESLTYISSANEGDALSTAAGMAIAGKPAVVMMQNSGLGNAISPLTSLAYVFRIPLLIIATHRGAPGLKDEPQHELMGQITGDLFDTMRTPWEVFPVKKEAIQPALQRACDYMQKERRPYAFIMPKGAVAEHELKNTSVPSVNNRTIDRRSFASSDQGRISRQMALKQIINNTPIESSVVIATTGFSGRELYAIDDRANHLYMVGSMGCASSLALGIALARPEKQTVIIDGDGAALMRMGNFATIGSYGQSNLVHILLDNEVHDSTGAQATVASNVQFADVAAACGYGVSYSGDDSNLIDALFELKKSPGPRFGHLKIRAGTIENLPRPNMSPTQVLQRLMQHINSTF
ncbi:MAG: phosphonopyruvate decarboxylase [Planctomycetota bacterium]|jgi:phosphonopyruvate decarboxylase